jgi:hypothetical protein
MLGKRLRIGMRSHGDYKPNNQSGTGFFKPLGVFLRADFAGGQIPD